MGVLLLQERALPRSAGTPESRGQLALVVTVVLTSLAIFVVAVRMFTRIGLVKLFGREDAMIMLSLVCLVSVSWGTTDQMELMVIT